jgi:hypothetical protein
LYGIEDELGAFCFDRAVTIFGVSLENEISSTNGRSEKDTERKRQRVMDKWLGIQPKFRDPVGMTSKKKQK